MKSLRFTLRALEAIRDLPLELRQQVGRRLREVQQGATNPSWVKPLAGSMGLYSVRAGGDSRVLINIRQQDAVVLDIVRKSGQLVDRIADVVGSYAEDHGIDEVAEQVVSSDRPSEELERIAPDLAKRLKEALYPQDAAAWWQMIGVIVMILIALSQIKGEQSESGPSTYIDLRDAEIMIGDKIVIPNNQPEDVAGSDQAPDSTAQSEVDSTRAKQDSRRQ